MGERDLRLLRLRLRNFKDFQDFTLDLGGQSASIYGDTGTGKSTLYDAFAWLLWGRDSLNRTDFDIKPLLPDGTPVHGLECDVEGVFLLGGKTGTLRRVYTEVWTKKKGEATKTFTGHTTAYYVDGVPVRERDYAVRIAELADEKIFRILTDPIYFAETLPWQDRRAILLQVCGDLADAEVIASEPGLAALTAILGDRTLDDHKKVIAAGQKKLNEALKEIPVRISEVSRRLPDIDAGLTVADAASALAEAKELHRGRVATVATGGADDKAQTLRAERDDIHCQMRGHEDAERTRLNDLLEAKRKEVNAADHAAWKADIEEQRLTIAVNKAETDPPGWEGILRNLATDFANVSTSEFVHTDETVCPTCGQAIPEGQVAAARAEALAAFNAKRSARLETIAKDRKAAEDGLQASRGRVEAAKKALAEVVAERERAVELLATLRAEAEHIEKTNLVESLTSTNEGYRLLATRYRAVSQMLAEAEAKTSNLEPDPEQERLALAVTEAEKVLADVGERDRGLARIEELKTEERRLAAEYERLEQERFLTEEFTRAKVRLLTGRINSRFTLARFKLFEVQVNGALNDVCEATHNGVPYNSGLNRGTRLNVGLDILNTLSDHYGFAAPVFVDNAEAVTEIVRTTGQMIRLYVHKPDKVLRVVPDPDPSTEQDEEAV